MKWPWVGREWYDDIRHALDLERKAHSAYADNAEAKIATLTERLLSLKMGGAVEVPKLPDLSDDAKAALGRIVAQPTDEMLALIDQRAGGNLRIRGMMLRQLAADRANKVSDEDIRAGIENGVQGSGVPS